MMNKTTSRQTALIQAVAALLALDKSARSCRRRRRRRHHLHHRHHRQRRHHRRLANSPWQVALKRSTRTITGIRRTLYDTSATRRTTSSSRITQAKYKSIQRAYGDSEEDALSIQTETAQPLSRRHHRRRHRRRHHRRVYRRAILLIYLAA